MKAVILAGGKGLRLREVIKDIPKPMAPVAGRPFLEHLVLQLIKWDIKEMIISIGYKGETIRSYFEDGAKWGAKLEYSEEKEPLGTGGALKKAAELTDGADFIAMNGDSFLEVDFNALADFHRKKQSLVTIGLTEVGDARRYGSVEVNARGEVVDFIEKGSGGSGVINGGVYIINRSIADSISPGNVSFETDVLRKLAGKGLYGMTAKGFFVDIGIPGDYHGVCNNFQGLHALCKEGEYAG